ncbi:MAG: UDP-N-acetylmuramoyl-L-alanine--D-glutamate ligase [Gemmatimonadaceae bacterium]|nr:UDP-N-acetylmuramoyl-L-alanine--D-glutamate ligase [Gemmatimonadaceae bacterium]
MRDWTLGEVAVVGLGKSGAAASLLLARHGAKVYASDAADAPSTRERAAQVRAAGAEADTGRHDLDRIAGARVVVASPGVPPDAPPLVRARDAGVEVVSEVEVGLSALPNTRIIAVTGTNGKTTVTALIAHLLRAIGEDAEAAGNIGLALCDVAIREVQPAWIALEMSSFQLHDTPALAPVVGVLTNLAPDHLDRYASLEAYYADKALLFRNGGRGSRWVINADDPASLAMIDGVPGTVLRFSAAGRLGDAFLDRRHDELIVADEPLLARRDLHLLGVHNVANALAAALAVIAASDTHGSIGARAKLAAGLSSFQPMPHRLAPVGEFDGVQWINDSKATNVASALVALESMTRPTVLLLGGRHKGEPYTALLAGIARHCRHVIAYGEAAPLILRDLQGNAPVEQVTGDFHAVTRRAHQLAHRGDAILLSPACSSYDMFNNYEERGRAFAQAAELGRP